MKFFCICTGNWLERFERAKECIEGFDDDFICRDEDDWEIPKRSWSECFVNFSFLNFKKQDTQDFQKILDLLDELYYNEDCDSRFTRIAELVCYLTNSDEYLCREYAEYDEYPDGTYWFIENTDWSRSILRWSDYVVALPCKLELLSDRAKWVAEVMRAKGEKDDAIAEQLELMDFPERKEWEWKFDKKEFLKAIDRRESRVESERFQYEQEEIKKWASYYAKYVE
jgi:hypothetical protein